MSKSPHLSPNPPAPPGKQTRASRGRHAMAQARVLDPMVAGLSAGLLSLCGALALWLLPAPPVWLPGALVTGIGVSLGGFALSGWRLHNRFLQPLSVLERSLSRVCQGEPEVHLEVQQAGALRGLVEDVHSLSEELNDLYEDMDNRVARQTRRLAQKTASLKILYEVAASINHAGDVGQLVTRYLRTLKDMVNGRGAGVRLKEPDGRMRLVASVGADGKVMLEHEMLPVSLCRCGKVLTPGEILCENDAVECSRRNGRRMFGAHEVEAVDVPLHYHDETLGYYRLYVDKPGIAEREDVMELLTTIGNHLGIAVAKQRSDAEARRLSIMEERTHLAHELHDSLAQTLAGLRFQVRMLQETLEQEHPGVESAALAEIHRLRSGVDEAHTELRELLNSFRAPLDRRGLLPALEDLAARFRRETGLATFFQPDCRQLQLSAHVEMQMLRIVQESLANIRKHAHAQTVRILLRCRAPGSYMLLVEDDGIGFERSPGGGRPGEHIGLSIMEERARSFGAHLRIESEPGEGTRVEMVFEPAAAAKAEVH